MKKLLKLLKGIIFLAIIISIINCDETTDSDPCDSSALNPSKSIQINGVVVATDGDFNNEENIIPVKIRFYKISCGESDPKPNSTFTYSGNLERPNYLSFESGIVGYELRNADDQIVVELLSDYDLDGVYDYITFQEYYNASHLSNSEINTIHIDY